MIDKVILICAFRYALGRMTYVPHVVSDYILEHWDKFTPSEHALFSREILAHKETFGDLGHSVDEDAWMRIVKRKTYDDMPF